MVFANFTAVFEELEAILEAVSLPLLVRDAHVGLGIGTAFSQYLTLFNETFTLQTCAQEPAIETMGCVLYDLNMSSGA